MIDQDPSQTPVNADLARFAAIVVGNTRARIGLFDGPELSDSAAAPVREPASIIERLAAFDPEAAAPIIIASVNPKASAAIESALIAAGRTNILRIGEDIPVPLSHTLDDEGAQTVGQDRLLCALGAWSRAQQACIVVDAGTAITVDFIDGKGIFHGGAIAPGANLMLKALHDHTAALPDISFEMPDPANPFGPNTPDAMRRGVAAAVRGLVRDLAEKYAIFYDSYPQVIATGGDAALLEDDALVEHIVPDLQLLGVQACVAAALKADDADDED